jgi:HD superfamily phosphohydrolase
MREAGPWGIGEFLLAPGKTITDPVHGDIFLTKLETSVIDSGPFQRLRRVKQLGNTHLVYPGATHTRFSHALGALRVAQDLLDTILDHRLMPGSCPDLLTEWRRNLAGEDGRLSEQAVTEWNREVGQAVVLARLGALMHDLCHVPFGHSVEDDLKLLTPHDRNVERFERLWAQMPEAVTTVISGDLLDSVRPLIISRDLDGHATATLKYPFVADIVGNTICADLLDYLRRDHLFTGLPLALGRRFETGFYVQPSRDPKFSSRLVLLVVRDGRERTDVITEILKHLRYRYELSERALTHHAKLGADAMVGKALEMWRDALVVEVATDRLRAGDADSAEWPAGRVPEDVVKDLAVHEPSAPDEVRKAVNDEIDKQLLLRGDDGLLEYLLDLPNAPSPSGSRDSSRRRAVSHLASDLLDRRLYKRIARQSHIRQPRKDFCDEFRDLVARRRLEQRAARFAGVDPAWHIAIWIPPADMRLKVADVLIDDGREVRKFVEREGELHQRGADIYALHQQLWEVSVYVHRSLSPDQQDLVLASLSSDLDMALVRPGTGIGEGVYEHPPHEWRDRLAIQPLREESNLTETQVVDLFAARRVRAARGEAGGAGPSLGALIAEYRQLLD